MQVILDVTTTQDGLLRGTAQWGTPETAVPFHGTLQLIAILESAAATDNAAAHQ